MTSNELNAMRDEMASVVAREIEERTFDNVDEGDNQDDYICPACSGSGEGQADGTTCRVCKGTGDHPPYNKADDPDYWDYIDDARKDEEV